MKGLTGLALTTGMLGCSQGTASQSQTSMPSTPGTTSATQGTRGKLVAAYANGVGQAAWSPDGTRIASISKDGSIQIWEAHSGKTLAMYDGHQGGAGCLSWAPDGKRIVSGGGFDGNPKDAMIQIWNPETGILLRNYTHPDGIPGTTNGASAVDWSPDGKYIASSVATVQVWNPDTGQQAYEYIVDNFIQLFYWLRWSPDSKRIATGCDDTTDEQSTASWDALTGTHLISYPVKEVVHLDWSPDGSKIVTASTNGMDVWDATSGKNLHSEADPNTISFVAWSPNGKVIASGGLDNQVRLWEPLTGHTLYIYQGHGSSPNGAIRSIAWSPDGSMIASVGNDSGTKVWMAV